MKFKEAATPKSQAMACFALCATALLSTTKRPSQDPAPYSA